MEWRGKPKTIRSDSSPEFISRQVKDWAAEQGIDLQFIQPGNPQQTACVERFNRTVRIRLACKNFLTALKRFKGMQLTGFVITQ